MFFANKTWTNICPLEFGKKYRLSFVPRELSSVGIHIHDDSGGHLYSYGIAGTAVISGMRYTYEIEAYFDGHLSLKMASGSLGEVSCEEIVEELKDAVPNGYEYAEMGSSENEI